ncbi:MAG: N-acetyltransferase family protein [Chitinophagales bacterium]
MDVSLRPLNESDYDRIIMVLNDWWGGRNMVDSLPRIFFKHFQTTSFVLEANDEIVAFLCGFVSPTYPEQAYIHFSGVHPHWREQGLAKRIYNAFFDKAHQKGCSEIYSITSPVNKDSIAFHRKMGFEILPGNREVEGVSVTINYNGPGKDRVLFVKKL